MPCGRLEDPSEDVFVANVCTSRGNYRIFEGVNEASAFHLQRFINIIERMPNEAPYERFREAVFSLLTLSEMVASRAKVVRNELGGEVPLRDIPSRLAKNLPRYRRRVRFSPDELATNGVDVSELNEFGFLFDAIDLLQSEQTGNTSLEKSPLILDNGFLYLLLPTAISTAIRHSVIDFLSASPHGRELLVKQLAKEYSRTLTRTEPIFAKANQPVAFGRTQNGAMAAILVNPDEGRYVCIGFLLDTLEEFDQLGFSGSTSTTDALFEDLDHYINSQIELAEANPDFVQGTTLLVGCGVGRALSVTRSWQERQRWPTTCMSAYDFHMLASFSGFTLLDIFRQLDGEAHLKRSGITLTNPSGFINLFAWSQSLDGHLVPHAQIPEEATTAPLNVMVVQNELLRLRHKILLLNDRRVLKNASGDLVPMRLMQGSFFSEDAHLPLYAAEELVPERGVAAAYETKKCIWWIELVPKSHRTAADQYERWRTLTTWLPKVADVLSERLKGSVPQTILFQVDFLGELGAIEGRSETATFNDTLNSIEHEIDKSESTIVITIGAEFEGALNNQNNIAESALVYAIVRSMVDYTGVRHTDEQLAEVVDLIVDNPDARHSHRFEATEFRQFLADQISSPPVLVNKSDEAIHKVGLGWQVRDKAHGREINTKEQCVEFLNSLVTHIEDTIISDLRGYHRGQVVEFCLLQHEKASFDRDNWRNTSAAAIGLRRDKDAARQTIIEHEFKLNAVLQASRLISEIAASECRIEGGHLIGELDFSRLMSKILLVSHYGNCSNAINLGAMEPSIRITPLGDIHMNYDFFEDVVEPFGRRGLSHTIDYSIQDYANKFETQEPVTDVKSLLDPEFVAAWNSEYGFSIDELRSFADVLENIGVSENHAVFTLKRSDILNAIAEQGSLTQVSAETIIDVLTLPARENWRVVPDGFLDADRQPWRFGRRLSVLRRPIVETNPLHGAELVIAPGLLREATALTVRNLHAGSVPHWQLESREMRRWAGSVFNRQGHEFAISVRNKFRSMGWKAEAEVEVTKLLRRGFDRNYGDVDVVAWDDSTKRIVLAECKDLKYKKTPGEIAEQLRDFQGELDASGKPDLLKKHNDRINIIEQNTRGLEKFCGFAPIVEFEHPLIFSNPVPMKYASNKLLRLNPVAVFDELGELYSLKDNST
eukprot:s1_g2399.t1